MANAAFTPGSAWFSVVLITKNEVDNLRRSLPPLTRLSDDILLVDGESTDGSVAYAQSLGARVIAMPWRGYAKTKNAGNEAARYPWILSIDADEVISEELLATLQTLRPEPQTVYALDRLTNFCGKWIRHSGWYPDWKVRLFPRNAVFWQGDYVHETLHIPDHFHTQRLPGYLYHYSYHSDQAHLDRIEKYARLSAKERFDRGQYVGWLKRYLSPPARFFRTYFLKSGWRDGKAGWTIARRNAYLVKRRYELLRKWQREKRTE